MKDGVSVLGMEVTNGNGDLFVITERGYGKRTPVADYPEQNRGGRASTPFNDRAQGQPRGNEDGGPAARAVHRDGGRDGHSR
ncbi:MAG: DNA gyrase C-terminal beta-propeller domain-containing protein [Collinsella sp.]